MAALFMVALAPGTTQGAAGDWDAEFRPNFTGRAMAAGVLADGRILVAAPVLIEPYESLPLLKRMRPDGQVDPAFIPELEQLGSYEGLRIAHLVEQADGKILISGIFPSASGNAVKGLTRLLANGREDTSFRLADDSPALALLALLPDGKMLVAGRTADPGPLVSYQFTLLRLHPDGKIDGTFQSSWPGWKLIGEPAILATGSGHILVAGHFVGADSDTQRRYCLRLDSTGAMDPAFDPVFRNMAAGESPLMPLALAELVDGKVLVGGYSLATTDFPQPDLVRLHADGTLDDTFHAETIGTVDSIHVQVDGRILVRDFYAERPLIRLLPSGAKDPEFNPPAMASVSGDLPETLVVQEDGALLVNGAAPGVGPRTPDVFGRLCNSASISELHIIDGSTLRWERGGAAPEVAWVTFEARSVGDARWSPLGAGTRAPSGWLLHGVSLPAKGSVRARGFTGRGSTAPAEVQLALGGAAPVVILEHPEGELIQSGTGVVDCGETWLHHTRLTSVVLRNTGDADLRNVTFTVNGPHAGEFSVVPTHETVLTPQAAGMLRVDFRPEGPGLRTASLTVSGSGVMNGPYVISLVGRAGPSLLPSFLSPTQVPAQAEAFAEAGRMLGEVTLFFEPLPGLRLTVARNLPPSASLADVPQAGLVTARFGKTTYLFQADYNRYSTGPLTLHLVAPGAPDIRFQPELRGGSVRALAEQPDGRLLFAGEFSSWAGHPRTHLARTFADGALDPTFTPVLTGPANALAVQADGKILVAGAFPSNVERDAAQVIRLLPDGRPDPLFSAPPEIGEVTCMLVQPDGKILTGGRAWNAEIGLKATLSRLQHDGTLESSPFLALASYDIEHEASFNCLALLPDGKILIGGLFDTVNGVPRAGLVRVFPDGTLDEGFQADGLQDASAIVVLPDRRILVAAGVGERTWLRLLPNGDTDAGFFDTAAMAESGYPIRQIVPQADGKVLLAGSFESIYEPTSGFRSHSDGVARVHEDGSIDKRFHSGGLFREHREINDLLIQSNGSLWAGATYDPYIARIFNDAASSRLELASPTTLLWRRTGAQEECSRVEFAAFDAATSAWRTLGMGTRTSAGWELAEALLPATGSVRVRGFLGSGAHGIKEDWLSLGAAVPELLLENVLGGPVPAGTGVLDFPLAPIWKSPQILSVRLRNTGTGVLEAPVISFHGPQASAFKVLNPPTTALGPQGDLELVLAFAPSGAGPHSAQLAVDYPGQSGGTYSVALHGQGVDTLSPHFSSPDAVGDAQWEFQLSGAKFGAFTLGFAPVPGLVLTVLDQTNDISSEPGVSPFGALLDGLPQEGEVTAEYAGRTYLFRANYNGGWDGQDLTLSLVGPGTPEKGFFVTEPINREIYRTFIYGASVAANQTIMAQGVFDPDTGLHEARRLRPDGSPLASAIALAGPGAARLHVAHALGDEGWLLGRVASPFAPSNQPGLIRLTAEGTVTQHGLPGMAINRLQSSYLQADGHMLMTGSFALDDESLTTTLARLLPDGSFDTAFRPDATPSFLGQPAVLGLPGGGVISGPHLVDHEGARAAMLVRWQPDGQRDLSFGVTVARSPVETVISAFALQADGKILVAGDFSFIGGRPRSYLARLHADGTVDESFAPVVENLVTSIVLQADGKIILTGRFRGCAGREQRGVARLLPDGTDDPTFEASLDDYGMGITLQKDGRLLVSGSFSRVNRFQRFALARLLNDPAVESLAVPDATTVRWLRGGSAPETHDVWFDATPDGGITWKRLGAGSRIPGGWEWQGTGLPPSGHVRARARVVGGYHNSSSSLVESVVLFGREPIPLEQWRTAHFGSPLSHGAAHDGADPDSDQLPNLVEYALGFDPQAADAAHAPSWVPLGDFWELRVTPSPLALGVACHAEWSPDMRPDSWRPVEDAGDATEHRFRVPAPSPASPSARFLRWRVSTAPAQ